MLPPKMSFAHIPYASLQIQMSSGKMLQNRNFLSTNTIKIRGDIDGHPAGVFVLRWLQMLKLLAERLAKVLMKTKIKLLNANC